MKVDHVQPFATATIQVLQTELGVTVRRGKLSVQRSEFTTREVTVLIGITGQIEGTVLYGTDRATVNRMVTAMLGEVQEEFNETSQSAVAEVGNVISGRAATLFEKEGIRCTISPPNLIIGRGARLVSVGIPMLIIPFETEIGDIELAVSIRET